MTIKRLTITKVYILTKNIVKIPEEAGLKPMSVFINFMNSVTLL
jgi:hypothetical protein